MQRVGALLFFCTTLVEPLLKDKTISLLISILLIYLFAYFVNQFSCYAFCKNEIVVLLFSVCFIRVLEKNYF